MARRVEIRCSPQTMAEMVVAPSMVLGDDDLVEKREALAHRILSFLSDKQREAVELRMAGYSYTEAAETLGISVRSVRVREARGMARIREIVEASPNEYQLP